MPAQLSVKQAAVALLSCDTERRQQFPAEVLVSSPQLRVSDEVEQESHLATNYCFNNTWNQ